MQLGSTLIDDTFAEAFRMRYARVIVTAHDAHWAMAAAREATGYGSSIIACDAEAGIERELTLREITRRAAGVVAACSLASPTTRSPRRCSSASASA